MDRSELARDLEYALEPQTVRTAASVRPAVSGQAVQVELPRPNIFELAFPPRTEPLPLPSAQPEIIGIAKAALRIAGYAFAGWLALVVTLIAVYRFANPPASALMLQHRLAGHSYRQIWVPVEAISPLAVRAVMMSEDSRFCGHWGIDYGAMQAAIEQASEGGKSRGASTISMQVVKNLFLWPSKSYVRKIVEVPLTYVLELLWSKERIMEVYLNIAEWGPGIFGIEAASRHHFAKSATRLTEREAAQLAVALPNPIRRDAGDPGPKTSRLASHVQLRMRAAPAAATACLRD